ncbi:MAG: YdjY domain-containing protein, partial [Gemmataceae bacterium]|nr:YdjY domain-containing protein [Gemmataceae bacterium]
MSRCVILWALCGVLVVQLPCNSGSKDDKSGGIKIDKEKRTVTIDAVVAPRKLPHLKEIYPLEVIASWPHPKGKKAHETIVTIDVMPSAVHAALVELGLKPGKPAMGGEKEEGQGPEVNIYLDIVQPDGETKRVSIDKTMVSIANGKPFPKSVKWRFTGSVMTKPDPNKNEEVYGADTTGTLISIFPVTNQTVLQTSLSMQYEKFMKLETNPKVLPKEGTPV